MNTDSFETLKVLWDDIEKQMLETRLGAHIKLTNAIMSYEIFAAKDGE